MIDIRTAERGAQRAIDDAVALARGGKRNRAALAEQTRVAVVLSMLADALALANMAEGDGRLVAAEEMHQVAATLEQSLKGERVRLPAVTDRTRKLYKHALERVAFAVGNRVNGLDGTWENWCYSSKYASDPTLLKKCLNNLCPFPPWEAAGQTCRGIDGSFLGTVLGTVGLPQPDEYDPENLITLPVRDPARYAVLTGYASVVVPVLGTGYMAQFVPPGIVLGLQLAIPLSLARGGWDRVWTKIFEPLLNAAGETGLAALDFALHGQSGIAKHAMLRVANLIPGYPIEKGILQAIAKEAPSIIDAVRDPTKIKEAPVFISIGNTLKAIAPTGPIQLAGGFLSDFGPSISGLLKGNYMEAVDHASYKVLGVSFTQLQKMPAEMKAQVASINPSALTSLGAALTTVQGFTTAMQKVNFPVIAKLLSNIQGQLGKITTDVKSLTGGKTSGPLPATTTGKTSGAAGTTSKPGAVTTSTAKPYAAAIGLPVAALLLNLLID